MFSRKGDAVLAQFHLPIGGAADQFAPQDWNEKLSENGAYHSGSRASSDEGSIMYTGHFKRMGGGDPPVAAQGFRVGMAILVSYHRHSSRAQGKSGKMLYRAKMNVHAETSRSLAT